MKTARLILASIVVLVLLAFPGRWIYRLLQDPRPPLPKGIITSPARSGHGDCETHSGIDAGSRGPLTLGGED